MLGRIFMGRYETTRLLGEGGMGKVYLARQLDLGRQVVVKVMHDHIAADPLFQQRFQRETLLMAKFQHPYAVTLHDASLNDPAGPCIVMEWIRGINLQELLEQNKRFSPGRVSRMLSQLCEVLQDAHDQGMIHRDLKPANLMMVDRDTPREKIKVMDFGLAKLVGTPFDKVTDDTSSAEFAVGTPGYICPEQVHGHDVDHRGDLYSVGVILYELLTGRLPFEGMTSMDLMLAHATERPPTFAEIGLSGLIPASVEQVVLRCLEKQPIDRPQSARELAEMYETALSIDQMGLDTPTPEDSVDGPSFSGPHLIHDPSTLSFQMEAYMPEAIALHKLRGFAHDSGGRVTDTVPGVIKLRIEPPKSGGFHWFGLSKRNGPLAMELHMHPLEAARQNHLLIQVLFRPCSTALLSDTEWRDRCTRLFIDLRGYLMGMA